MRVGNKRVDMGDLARRERVAPGLLLRSGRDFIECGSDNQYGFDHRDDHTRQEKQ